MKNQHALLVVLMALLAVGTGCKKQKTEWQPQPPFPGLELPKTSYLIDNRSDTTLITGEGTTIFIPRNCFTTANNDSVAGEVTIIYREFHDAVDIFLSGIPMEFMSMGEKRYFRTAGMFEIDAQAGGAKANLKPGKTIDVRMPSQRPELDYSFFYMNPEKGAWEWVDLPENEANAEKIEATTRLESMRKTPDLISDEYFVANYEGLLDVYYDNNFNKIYKARNDEALRQKMATYKFRIYDMTMTGEIRFGNAYYHPLEMLWKEVDGKPVPNWVSNFCFSYAKDAAGKWGITNFKLRQLGGNLHEVTYKKDGLVFKKKMEAVIPLKNLLKLPADQWKKKYNDELALLAEEQQKIDVMAETFRAVSINQLGIYNFDALLKLSDWIAVEPTYTLDGNSTAPSQVVLILGDRSGFIHLKGAELQSIRINPRSNHRVFMKMEGTNQIGVFRNEMWSRVNTDYLRSIDRPPFAFDFEAKRFDNAVEFRTFLGF